ncbi:hypothetical protein FHR99_003238 [Litorivivens lipolytica]|uniref:Uncharacterized protein n=1 Tax=Litorivivens lipolytica TaxID=1524264 RepID=A0A7W4Z6X0_9GAMM|nr:hypothetical protein [Litorivivens lipolytica]MBB3048964.1 hypothetical protein [Litorivivens lipolytica]
MNRPQNTPDGMTFSYGDYERSPVVMLKNRRNLPVAAAIYVEGSWQRLDTAEAFTKAGRMERAPWAERFGRSPTEPEQWLLANMNNAEVNTDV